MPKYAILHLKSNGPVLTQNTPQGRRAFSFTQFQCQRIKADPVITNIHLSLPELEIREMKDQVTLLW